MSWIFGFVRKRHIALATMAKSDASSFAGSRYCLKDPRSSMCVYVTLNFVIHSDLEVSCHYLYNEKSNLQ